MSNITMAHIDLLDLINKCSNGKKTNEEIFKDISTINRENIHEIFKYKKFYYDFSDYLTIYQEDDNKDILGAIRPCYREFLANTLRFLDIRGEREDNEQLTQDALKQVEKLANIKTETELKDSFPVLFQDLLNGRNYMNTVRKKPKEEQEELKHYFYSCAMQESLKGFVKTQSEAYRRYITDRYKYGSKTLRTEFNEYIKENFDINKVAFYIADLYLTICEKTDDLSIIDKYLPILKAYQKSDYNKKVSIMSQKGKKIEEYDFDYRMICLQHRVYDLRHKKVNWEITKPSSRVVKTSKQPRQLKLASEETGQIRRIASEKEKFYKEHKPKLIITGIKGLEGYIAYVYENGEVILDKDSTNLKNAAMYNFKVVDFDTLTKLNTKELKKDKRATWKQHRKGWQQEIEKIIEREATEQDKKDVNEFIKKHK